MFKVVPEFPNLSCDQNGNVKMNYKDTKNTYNEYINYKGYLVARIKTQGNSFIRMKHRLIAQTWLSNPFKLTEVNHIDGVKTNNTLTNLEYITHKNNMIHATKNNLLKNQHNVSLYKNNEFYKEFPSLKELGKYLGVGGLALVNKIKYSKIFNLIKEKDGKVNNFYIEIKNSKGFKKTTNSGKPSVQYFVYDIVNNKYHKYETLLECSYETTIIPTNLVMQLKGKDYYIHRPLGYIISIKEFDHLDIPHKKLTLKKRLENIKFKVDQFNEYLNKI